MLFNQKSPAILVPVADREDKQTKKTDRQMDIKTDLANSVKFPHMGDTESVNLFR